MSARSVVKELIPTVDRRTKRAVEEIVTAIGLDLDTLELDDYPLPSSKTVSRAHGQRFYNVKITGNEFILRGRRPDSVRPVELTVHGVKERSFPPTFVPRVRVDHLVETVVSVDDRKVVKVKTTPDATLVDGRRLRKGPRNILAVAVKKAVAQVRAVARSHRPSLLDQRAPSWPDLKRSPHDPSSSQLVPASSARKLVGRRRGPSSRSAGHEKRM